MKKLIKKLPLPIAGLMLGLAACGNLVLSYGNLYRNIFGIAAAIILVLLLIKAITEPKSVAEGFANPVVASVIPTFSMGTMLLATYIKPYLPTLSLVIWIIGLCLHCVLIIYFTWKYIVKLDIKKVFPSYFIVYVGIAVASVTAPTYGLFTLGQYTFWYGLITYLILLPVVCYRVLFVKGMPEPALPTIIIFAAPANLCLAGYLNSFQNKNITMVAFLAILGLIMTVSSLLYLPKMLKLKFYPSYSSLTFPFVISGIAIKLTNGFLIKSGNPIAGLKYVVKFEEIFSVIMVIYVLIRYIRFLFAKEQTVNKVTSVNS